MNGARKVGAAAGGLIVLAAVFVAPIGSEGDPSPGGGGVVGVICREPGSAAIATVLTAGTTAGGTSIPIVGRFLVSSNFGPRWGTNHDGIDLATAANGPTLAFMAGTVVAAGPNGGAGNWVRIDHGGNLFTVYMHHSRVLVTVGQQVAAGQQIGVQGSTGASDGPHLHFEVRPGDVPTDPRPYLANVGLTIPAEGEWGEGPAAPGAASPGGAAPAAAVEPVSAVTKTAYSLGNVKPQTATVADAVGPMFGIKTVGGYRDAAGEQYDPNGHPAGLALDFMINDVADGKDVGDRLAKHLQDNAVDLGVEYVIWQQRIWMGGQPVGSWKPMEDRGSPTQNHMDHVHLSLTGKGASQDSAPGVSTAGTVLPECTPEQMGLVSNVTPISAGAPAGLNDGAVPAWALPWVVKAGAICPEIPPAIVAAQIDQESKWNPKAVNPNSGASGLSQFMPATFAAEGQDDDGNGVASPFDVGDAIMAQGRYDCKMVKFARDNKVPGDILDLALAGYNAGPHRLTEFNGVPPYRETQDYIPLIKGMAADKYAATK